MAKKTKKSQRTRAQRRPVPQATFDRPVKAAAAPAPKEAAVAPGYKRGQAVDFKQEYRYVLKDLRRLGIIAAVMLVVLVALSLLLA